jgi:prepilin-type N-terminal cleavage/methylation domain-containing protein
VSRRPLDRGYTLIEIVVVLSIVAVVTAMVVPSMLSRTPAPELRSADDVASLLRGARRAALEQAVTVTVTLAPAARTYLVETETGDSSSVLAQGALALAPGVRLASDRPATRFLFDRLGGADPDSVAVIGAEGSAMVLVDRWTGEIGVRAGAR